MNGALPKAAVALAIAVAAACADAPPERAAAMAAPADVRRITTSGWVVSADDVRIRYEVTGSGATTLVFVHGWMCDSRYWRLQVPHYADRQP
jgi:hypothetical protein